MINLAITGICKFKIEMVQGLIHDITCEKVWNFLMWALILCVESLECHLRTFHVFNKFQAILTSVYAVL